MSKHISDELPRLLTGDATHDVVMEAAEHLRTCPDCQQELVSSVVAHASLTSAHRFAPEVVSPAAPRPGRGSTPPAVTRIHATEASDDEAGDDEAGDEYSDDAGTEDAAVERLPDMSGMFDRVRAEAAQARSAPLRGRRGLLAVATAAVVFLGGGAAIGYAVESGGSGGSGGQTVAMHHFDVGHGTGKATISGDTVTLDAASLPKLSSSQRYEVWLTDSARKHMYSIGFMGDGSTASFKVKHAYLDRYSAIEVSRQNAGQVDYSGVSVLRGHYS